MCSFVDGFLRLDSFPQFPVFFLATFLGAVDSSWTCFPSHNFGYLPFLFLPLSFFVFWLFPLGVRRRPVPAFANFSSGFLGPSPFPFLRFFFRARRRLRKQIFVCPFGRLPFLLLNGSYPVLLCASPVTPVSPLIVDSSLLDFSAPFVFLTWERPPPSSPHRFPAFEEWPLRPSFFLG